MSSTAPWWSFLVAPAATIIAFGLGILASWWSDRRKWNREDVVAIRTHAREDKTRYHKDRLECYVNFFILGDQLSTDVAAHWEKQKEHGTNQMPMQYFPEFREMRKNLYRMRMLSSAPTIKAAEGIFKVIDNFFIGTYKDAPEGGKFRQILDAEREFAKAIREELGVEVVSDDVIRRKGRVD